MGRYAVELDPHSPVLSQWYHFKWAVIGNLGVDLLIVPMSAVFGLELGVKLIVIAIPVLTVAGLLAVAREIHGRIPPTALFALPIAYSHPLIFGFVNYALSLALALLAFALWLKMGRANAPRLRAPVFAIVALLVWLTHTFGWGLLGIMCFCAEVVQRRGKGATLFATIIGAMVACLPLAPPLVLMAVWRSGGGAAAEHFGWWSLKLDYVAKTLRDRWRVWDMASLAVMLAVAALPIWRRYFTFSPLLIVLTAVLCAIFLAMPRAVFGSYYADMRMTPLIVALAVIAVRPRPALPRRALEMLAIGGVAFFAGRLAGHAASFAIIGADMDRALVALDHVPRGARVLNFTGIACGDAWTSARLDHIGGLAIVRRGAFSNDQWSVKGAELMTITRPDAGYFANDRSQGVTGAPCPMQGSKSIDESLRTFPRSAFDYVWLVHPPKYDARLLRGLVPVWASATDRLYRIDASRPVAAF